MAQFEAKLAELIALEPAVTAATERLMAIDYPFADYVMDTLRGGFEAGGDLGSPRSIREAPGQLRRCKGSQALAEMDRAGWVTEL